MQKQNNGSMSLTYFTDKTFEKVNFKNDPLEKGEYEQCSFKECDLSEADLSQIKFIECHFTNCNLSLAKLGKTSFQDTVFKNCKLLGLHFEHCHDFNLSFSFEHCVVDHSSFYGMKIRKTIFKNCQLTEVDFTASDLSESLFDNCDLDNATFENTNLEKSNLFTSRNYRIDPEMNKVKKAKFSLSGLPGLLTKYNIEIDITR